MSRPDETQATRTTVEVRSSSVLADPRSLGLVLPSEERYEFRDLLGRGGVGEVHRVFDRSIRREVALKLMRPDRASASSTSRFVEEAQVGGQLEHPNIAPIHEVGITSRGQVYFTMKLVEGRSLRDALHAVRELVRQGFGDESFPLGRRLEVWRKVCDAVGFAHSRGVIHRDLKPANVMLGEHGEVVVMDWGLAKILGVSGPAVADAVVSDRREEGLDPTRQGVAAGTPGYMAPEQIRGEVDRLDERSDVYALGAILYEVLSFAKPFDTGDAASTLLAALQVDPERPSRRIRRLGGRAPAVPRELEAIAMRALARDPARRYASVVDLAREVEAFLADRPVAACPDTMPRRIVKWTRRHPVLALSAALLSVAAGVLSIVISEGRSRVHRAARQAAEEAHANEVLRREMAESELERRRIAEALASSQADLVRQVESKGVLERALLGHEREPLERDFEEGRLRALEAGRIGREYLSGLDEGRWAEIEPLLASTSRADPVARALARSRTGDVTGALALYRQTVEASPDRWDAWTELGFLLVEQDETGPAAEALQAALDRGAPAGLRPRLEEALAGLRK